MPALLLLSRWPVAVLMASLFLASVSGFAAWRMWSADSEVGSNDPSTDESSSDQRDRFLADDAPSSIANSSRLASLSRRLNSVQRRLQQLACLDRTGPWTTDTGGWCDRAASVEHQTDAGLARALAVLLFGRRVAGLGDGLGRYRRLVLETGFVDRYDAYDGAPFVEEATDGRVTYVDLAVPQFWLPVYDWTICLEVMEHIPERYESTALDNVVRPARVGTVLSWARPGQSGLGHVNTRSQRDADALMERRGFELDVAASNGLRDSASFAWFKFTLNVYRRSNESIRLFDFTRRLERDLLL